MAEEGEGNSRTLETARDRQQRGAWSSPPGTTSTGRLFFPFFFHSPLNGFSPLALSHS